MYLYKIALANSYLESRQKNQLKMDIQLTDFCMIKHCCFNSITLGISPASSYCSGYPFSFHDYMRHKDKLITVPLCILKLGRGRGVGGGTW